MNEIFIALILFNPSMKVATLTQVSGLTKHQCEHIKRQVESKNSKMFSAWSVTCLGLDTNKERIE